MAVSGQRAWVNPRRTREAPGQPTAEACVGPPARAKRHDATAFGERPRGIARTVKRLLTRAGALRGQLRLLELQSGARRTGVAEGEGLGVLELSRTS
jgi:hypothetical protein